MSQIIVCLVHSWSASAPLIVCFFPLEYSNLLHKQHQLKKTNFSVEVIKDTDTPPDAEYSDRIIEVNGLTTSMTEEMLEMYFESRKSGGKQNAIEKCEIIKEGAAHLTFNDAEGKLNLLVKPV